MRCFLVSPGFVMLGCLTMMFGGLFVMVRRLFMVLMDSVLWHVSLPVYLPPPMQTQMQ
jgi:hypothetical protein